MSSKFLEGGPMSTRHAHVQPVRTWWVPIGRAKRFLNLLVALLAIDAAWKCQGGVYTTGEHI